MKKLLLAFSLLVVLSVQGFSQKFFVTGFVGYTLNQNFTISGYSGEVADAPHFGGGLEFMVHPNYGIELLYQYEYTKVHLYNYSSFGNMDANVGISYVMAGSMRYIPFLKGLLNPYVGVNLGVGILSPENAGTDTRFAWGAKLGLKVKATPVLSFRAQAQLYSIVRGIDGSSFWVGTGGAGVSLSSYSSLYQVGFTAGVSLGF